MICATGFHILKPFKQVHKGIALLFLSFPKTFDKLCLYVLSLRICMIFVKRMRSGIRYRSFKMLPMIHRLFPPYVVMCFQQYLRRHQGRECRLNLLGQHNTLIPFQNNVENQDIRTGLMHWFVYMYKLIQASESDALFLSFLKTFDNLSPVLLALCPQQRFMLICPVLLGYVIPFA